MASAAAGYIRRLTRRLTEDLEDLDAEEMAESSHATGALPVVSCTRGQEVTMFGRLRSVESSSKTASASVEAELFDGTDSILLVWIGRRRIPGIEPGKTLQVRGRVGEREGRKAIYNPYYELRDPA
ncbi:OB-fold nucleic acid binding domain-containing protein [Rhodococcus sp. HNM0563]|uniref:OB-fold nucleic acid binding domain-containing protein n=1 Tax=unclassified Rhodococcus (in: high G+C Gram-positive bacteria) TaxID=192944 RepID=UPI00146E7554|nr:MULTISPECIES: OB-fold nucleic acid binding domain-containing protein [unclassified Rhodococcus (in: high G+C Gram-positive bacteria)]MCK0092212.1 OB-fold nucleic acid binding domain-containing protein [Rhodococcus sp. F64268]NLU63428.1 OB-fold nucleic acid binding domain-containing protein [Rhodococcus sp. HNM0563]